MGKKNKNQDILINILLDRSGSMNHLQSEVIGHYNRYIEEQRALPGKATVSLVLFDDQYEEVYVGRDINAVPELTNKTYWTRGMTAYLDAIGKLIKTVEGIKNKPEKVVFVVNTDGLENASKEYTLEKVKELVDEKSKGNNWQFVFVGAGLPDSAVRRFTNTSGFGSYFNTASASGDAVGASYSTLNRVTTGYRTGSTPTMDVGSITISDEEAEKEAKKNKK